MYRVLVLRVSNLAMFPMPVTGFVLYCQPAGTRYGYNTLAATRWRLKMSSMSSARESTGVGYVINSSCQAILDVIYCTFDPGLANRG